MIEFTLVHVLAIVFLHWVCDFIFQDETWANNKSKSNIPLLKHTATYSVLWFPLAYFLGWLIIPFILITFVTHTITDYITSRIVGKKFAAGEYGSPIPNFGAFTIIGFDQLIHYVTLFITFGYLMSL